MYLFTDIPEALNYGPGQSWLSPEGSAANRRAVANQARLSPRARLRHRAAELRAALRRVEEELDAYGDY